MNALNIQPIAPPQKIETENVHTVRTLKRMVSKSKQPLEKYAASAGSQSAPDPDDIVEAFEQVEQNVSRAIIVEGTQQFIITLPPDAPPVE